MKYICALSLALFLTSCYHFGTVGCNKNVQITEIENITEEAGVAATFRKCLAEQLGTRPGIRRDAPQYTLSAKILQITNKSQARAEIRDKKSRNDDGDAYQTVLYEVDLTVQYQFGKETQGEADTAPVTGTVVGKASLPRMHDRNVALQTALRQAAHDAARQIAAIIADAH